MKDVYTQIGEAVPQLTASQWVTFKSWRESAKPTPEQQLHHLDSLLGGRTQRESGPIVKNNGRADNGGQEFRESTDNRDGGSQPTGILKEAYKLADTYVKHHNLSESDARKVVGLPEKKKADFPEFSEAQYNLYAKLILAGRPEREAFHFVSQ